MKMGSIDSIESFGLVDGPGIRTVVFLSGCRLRCKYCHNPEMWKMGVANYTASDLARRIIRNKPYFRRNQGGVTFSGGEPLLQSEFLIEVCKILKKEDIHIALDTAGVGNGNYEELLSYVDLVLFDVKHVTEIGYKEITNLSIDSSLDFIEALNRSEKKVWIRQVIVPGIMDNDSYLIGLNKVLKNIKNIERIEFLPYHTMGKEKYKKLGIDYPYEELEEMDKEKCELLYQRFMRDFYGRE
ncbi:MAG: pyruvate formate lyase-activating protein [Bacilli bacterium]|nr:pyruvate formate lyase-activating protein [Bacilli bacterium]